jgi:hypothetical protein
VSSSTIAAARNGAGSAAAAASHSPYEAMLKLYSTMVSATAADVRRRENMAVSHSATLPSMADVPSSPPTTPPSNFVHRSKSFDDRRTTHAASAPHKLEDLDWIRESTEMSIDRKAAFERLRQSASADNN